MFSILIAGAVAMILATGAASTAMDRRRAQQALARQAAENQAGFLRDGQFAIVLRPMLANFFVRVTPLRQQALKHETAAASWETRKRRVDDDHGPTTVGRVLTWGALSLAWVILVLLNLSADIYLLVAVGWSLAVSQVLAVVLVTVYAVIGVVLAGLVGLHSLLPASIKVPGPVRNMAIVALLIAGVGLAIAVAQVAPYRAAGVAAAMANAKTVLAQVQAAGGTPAAIDAQTSVIEGLSSKKAASEGMAVLLSVAGILGEIVTSWAPLLLLGAVVGPLTGAIANLHRRKAVGYRNRVEVAETETRAAMTNTLAQAGVDPTTVDAFIADTVQATPGEGGGGEVIEGEVVHDHHDLPPAADHRPDPSSPDDPPSPDDAPPADHRTDDNGFVEF